MKNVSKPYLSRTGPIVRLAIAHPTAPAYSCHIVEDHIDLES
jgi:hypothetical protein